MGLLPRTSLALLAIFAAGGACAAYAMRTLLEDDVQRETMALAKLMMESAGAVRTYTATEIRPLLVRQTHGNFLPQSVPAYAAKTNFEKLHRDNTAYTYREPTLNPTNLEDRATDWEADVIQKFRNNPELAEYVGQRAATDGPSLFYAKPIRATAECLECHSVPKAAPAAMIAKYGSVNGFGWQNGEVVAANVVSVPLATARAKASAIYNSFLALLLAVFAAVFLAVNSFLYFSVVRPLSSMARTADQVSTGDLSAPEFSVDGARELATLGRSFNRMRESVQRALRSLGSLK